ncbi:MAG: RNA polymerase sigma factor [Bacillota bacterium]|nr:RNA polymerase sigma factor [Bacillota bacterium]
MDKTTLIKKCQLGDLESLNTLYKSYVKNALGTAYLIAGNKGLAEDIVQEAFIQCFESIKSLKNIETFDIWFYKILTRTGWKTLSKHNNLIPTEGIYDNSLPSHDNSIETKIIVSEALNKLSIPIKTVITLYYFNDLSIKEISSILGCFEGTVKSRLHNGKKQLKQILGEDIDEYILKSNYLREGCTANGK